MPRIALLLLAALLSPVALAARSLEPPKANEKWITLRADEFRFVSNVSPAKTLDIARDLLRMRAALGAVTNLKVRSALPTSVFIFANERAFGPYRDAVLQRKSDHIVGVFTGTQTDNFILVRSDVAEIDQTVYHELTHYFVRNTTGPLPLWISEGIAEYYSTFTTSGNDVHIGRPIAEHVHWLRASTMIPLRDLFATTSASPIYNEGTRTGVFYAQSWALFHYLMSDADRRLKFSRFLQLLGADKSADEAFETAFAVKYSDLEQELRKYVRRNAFTYVKHSLAELPVAEPPKPEPMAHGDVLFALAHLLGHTDGANAAIAERYLRESLGANPRNAAAHADLGRLHELANRRAEADAAYRTAVELGSGDAGVYLFAALSLVQRFAGKLTSEIPAEDLRYARSLFRRASELDPTMALAWAGLGTTYLGERDLAPGITALEKSLQLAPGDEQAAFHLLQLYVGADRHQDAVRMFDTVLVHSSDAAMVAHAREALLMAEVRKVERLADEQKPQEAMALAKSLMARTTDESLKEHLAGFIQSLDAMAAAEVVNRAISHANAGNNVQALKILDEVMPTITDPDLRKEAERFRADVAKRVMKKK
ncbi:MAG TPA: DUF1570 domain-containing protein [Thermoanaerobaculia bacterium]|jgi:Flp pilus assembly protein TadD